jgi:hypothetical protein
MENLSLAAVMATLAIGVTAQVTERPAEGDDVSACRSITQGRHCHFDRKRQQWQHDYCVFLQGMTVNDSQLTA